MNEVTYHLRQVNTLINLLSTLETLPVPFVHRMEQQLTDAGYFVMVVPNYLDLARYQQHPHRLLWIRAHDRMTAAANGHWRGGVVADAYTADPRRWGAFRQSLRRTYRELLVNLIGQHAQRHQELLDRARSGLPTQRVPNDRFDITGAFR